MDYPDLRYSLISILFLIKLFWNKFDLYDKNLMLK